MRFAIIFVLLLFGIPFATAQEHTPRWPTDILRDTFGFGDATPAKLPLDELQQGCPRRDCIPSIDAPRFVPAAEAKFLRDDDIVLAIDHGGVTRAFPILLLNAHEIVNDTIAGVPVAVTFCPLCGSGLAFERTVAGQVTEFGVSGLLYRNDLVMYDRNRECLWQQITGEAIAGTCLGEELTSFPSTMTTWAGWRDHHPDTTVLTSDDVTRYRRNPYGDYDESERLLFPVADLDRRMHPKTPVYGVVIDGQPLAVPMAALDGGDSVDVKLGNRRIQLRRDAAGTVTVSSADGREQWLGHRMFWFAWATFNPSTALYRPAGD